jgi:signal transduction histidine kinase
LHDSGMRERAASLGAKITADDGVNQAVQIIRKYI